VVAGSLAMSEAAGRAAEAAGRDRHPRVLPGGGKRSPKALFNFHLKTFYSILLNI